MKRRISYVFPIYNEAGNIDLLHDTVRQVVKPLAKRYQIELVFVNDGSSDDSLDKLLAIQQRHKDVTVINFARNFGHQMAVTAGLDYASGDAVIIMDSDMQDPPRVSLELIEQWEAGYEVVYAQRRSRQDSLFKRATAHFFYYLLSKIANINIPRDTGDFRLIDRRVVDALRQFKEHNRFLRGMVSYVGFRQKAVLFDRDERHAGTTGYPLSKMIKFALDGILSFSSAPLTFITKIGSGIAALSFLGIIYALIMKFYFPEITVEGWTFIAIAILFMGGVQIIMLGVLGSYIGRIYTESQNRPLYIVSKVYRRAK